MTYLAALPLNYFVTLGLPCKKSGKCGCRLVYLPCRGPGTVTSDCPSATTMSARKEMNTLWLAGSSFSKFGSWAKLKKGERTTMGKLEGPESPPLLYVTLNLSAMASYSGLKQILASHLIWPLRDTCCLFPTLGERPPFCIKGRSPIVFSGGWRKRQGCRKTKPIGENRASCRPERKRDLGPQVWKSYLPGSASER